MHQRHHRGNAEIPLEPEPGEQRHEQHRQAHRPQTVGDQFIGNLARHAFDAGEFHALVILLQRGAHLAHHALHGAFLAFRQRQADEDGAVIAEFLQGRIAHAHAVHAATQRVERRRLGKFHLHGEAANEIHTKVEAAHRQQGAGPDGERQRQCKRDEAEFDKANVGVVGNKFQRHRFVLRCSRSRGARWSASAPPSSVRSSRR